MKSVVIGFIAQIQFLFQIGICLVIAVFLLSAGHKYRKKYRLVFPAFISAAILVAWLPFWGYFPGMLLAKKTCDDIGGIHSYAKLPVTTKSIHFENSIFALEAKSIADLLVSQGFESVDESLNPKSSLSLIKKWKQDSFGKSSVVSYRLADINSSDCESFRGGIEKDFGLAIEAYQHGVRHDQCIVIKPILHSDAQIVNKVWSASQRFPIRTEIVHAGYYYASNQRPIAEQRSFYYYARNPYAGPTPHVECNWKGPYRFDDTYGQVVTGVSPNYPKNIFIPIPVNKELKAASIELEDMGINTYYELSRISEIRKKILGLEQNEFRVWVDAPISGSKSDVLIIEKNGTEETIVLPEFERNIQGRGQITPRIHALLKHDENYIVVRGDLDGLSWEVFTYSPNKQTLLKEQIPIRALIRKIPTQEPYALVNNDVFLTNVAVTEDVYRLDGYIVASLSDTTTTRVFGKISFDIPRNR